MKTKQQIEAEAKKISIELDAIRKRLNILTEDCTDVALESKLLRAIDDLHNAINSLP